jgi:hypothetical protein
MAPLHMAVKCVSDCVNGRSHTHASGGGRDWVGVASRLGSGSNPGPGWSIEGGGGGAGGGYQQPVLVGCSVGWLGGCSRGSSVIN